MSITNKTAIITGATGGIGLAIAEALAKEGVNIVVSGRNEEKAHEIAQSLSNTFDIISSAFCGDLTEGNVCENLLAQTLHQFGSCDIIINNAGIQHVSPIEDFAQEEWDTLLALHLTVAFKLAKLSIPHMRKNRWGRIINISSVHGIVASPFKAAYVAAKHGLNGLTKVIALETAEDGITCNAICPGYVWTQLVKGQIEQQAAAHKKPKETIIRDVILEPQPNKQFILASEVGDLCVFLCSNGGKNITGQALTMDGGWTAR